MYDVIQTVVTVLYVTNMLPINVLYVSVDEQYNLRYGPVLSPDCPDLCGHLTINCCIYGVPSDECMLLRV